jgi:hypothetical protein
MEVNGSDTLRPDDASPVVGKDKDDDRKEVTAHVSGDLTAEEAALVCAVGETAAKGKEGISAVAAFYRATSRVKLSSVLPAVFTF